MIPEKLKKLLKSGETIYLATSSKTGIPNLVAVESMGIIDNKILIADCHFSKTRTNIKENPVASLLTTDEKEYFQIKGKTEYKTSGKEFDKLKKELTGTGFTPIGALLVSADEIYNLQTYERIC